MKQYLSLTITTMALVAVMAGAAQAQTSGAQNLRAHIPFAFHVGAKELPAGDYKIAVLNPSSDRKVLQLRSVDGRVSAIVNTIDRSANAAAKSKLVFHRYGESYYFAQAHVLGESTTLAAVKSSAERIEAEATARTTSRSVVAVAF